MIDALHLLFPVLLRTEPKPWLYAAAWELEQYTDFDTHDAIETLRTQGCYWSIYKILAKHYSYGDNWQRMGVELGHPQIRLLHVRVALGNPGISLTETLAWLAHHVDARTPAPKSQSLKEAWDNAFLRSKRITEWVFAYHRDYDSDDTFAAEIQRFARYPERLCVEYIVPEIGKYYHEARKNLNTAHGIPRELLTSVDRALEMEGLIHD